MTSPDAPVEPCMTCGGREADVEARLNTTSDGLYYWSARFAEVERQRDALAEALIALSVDTERNK